MIDWSFIWTIESDAPSPSWPPSALFRTCGFFSSIVLRAIVVENAKCSSLSGRFLASRPTLKTSSRWPSFSLEEHDEAALRLGDRDDVVDDRHEEVVEDERRADRASDLVELGDVLLQAHDLRPLALALLEDLRVLERDGRCWARELRTTMSFSASAWARPVEST